MVPRCTKILNPFSLIFGTFLVQILCWFGFKNIPKTSTLFSSMVLVWFWYGFGIVTCHLKAGLSTNPFGCLQSATFTGLGCFSSRRGTHCSSPVFYRIHTSHSAVVCHSLAQPFFVRKY